MTHNRSTKFDVLSAWTQNGVDKIDIRKSIIPRIERVTIVPQNCVQIYIRKSIISRIERVTIVSQNCVPKCVIFFYIIRH